MEEQSVFQDLKLRIGYGQSGNQNIDPYTSQRLYGPQSSQFMYNGEWINSYGVSQNPNPDLKWETTAMTNIGLDYTIWEGRVSGTLDFYNKETKDWKGATSDIAYNAVCGDTPSINIKQICESWLILAEDNSTGMVDQHGDTCDHFEHTAA